VPVKTVAEWRMAPWLKISLALLGIWAVAGGVIYWARAEKPTPQSIAAYMRSADITSKTGADRDKVIHRVEEMFNGISYEDRQELRSEGLTNHFFGSLTPDEQGQFLDATLPTGFKQMMDSFNKMDHARRKQFVDRALARMRQDEGERPPPNLDDKNVQRIVDQGLRSFYSDANADVKLDLAPLIEQMQRNVQGR